MTGWVQGNLLEPLMVSFIQFTRLEIDMIIVVIV